MRNAPARVSGAALRVQEELGPVALVEVGAAAGVVAAERVDGLAADRDDALLRALADRADEPPLEVDRRAVETDGLAHAEAGAVEQLDERAVAQRARRRAGRGLDQPLDLAGRERLRQRAPAARQLELGGGVVGARAEQHLVPVEGAERRDAARDRRRREPVGAQLRDVGGELVGRRVVGRAAEPGLEVAEVAPVRVDRARREPRSREREEGVDGGRHRPFAFEPGLTASALKAVPGPLRDVGLAASGRPRRSR